MVSLGMIRSPLLRPTCRVLAILAVDGLGMAHGGARVLPRVRQRWPNVEMPTMMIDKIRGGLSLIGTGEPRAVFCPLSRV
jgi:hypothetical protein